VQGEGKPLVILHGLLGSLDNWQVMSKRLAKLYRVCSVDLRNHGRSPHSDLMNYPVMAEDVRRTLVEHDLAPATLLGHSMGGKVAMQLAGGSPADVENLIVVDIAPKAYPPAHAAMLDAMRAVDLSASRSFADVSVALVDAIPHHAERQFIMKNLARDSAGALYWRIGLDEIIKNYPALTQAVTLSQPFLKPVCFIRAGRSVYIQDDDDALIRRSFPHAQLRTIADAGHWVHVDCADEFHSTVTQFLSPRV
ncbi:MAG TPA: alpha/beta fold hydrolase, partial [Candidatus Binatia bacterium]|nr:alpha/beta fold hydrolase [Candidatus Binatia bacterium]